MEAGAVQSLFDNYRGQSDSCRVVLTGNRHRRTNGRCGPTNAKLRKLELAVLVIFLLGIGNFAMHKAVLESGHPLLGKMPWFIHMLGGRITLVTEFLLLLAAMLLA